MRKNERNLLICLIGALAMSASGSVAAGWKTNLLVFFGLKPAVKAVAKAATKQVIKKGSASGGRVAQATKKTKEKLDTTWQLQKDVPTPKSVGKTASESGSGKQRVPEVDKGPSQASKKPPEQRKTNAENQKSDAPAKAAKDAPTQETQTLENFDLGKLKDFRNRRDGTPAEGATGTKSGAPPAYKPTFAVPK